jgi:hypothetical protein
VTYQETESGPIHPAYSPQPTLGQTTAFLARPLQSGQSGFHPFSPFAPGQRGFAASPNKRQLSGASEIPVNDDNWRIGAGRLMAVVSQYRTERFEAGGCKKRILRAVSPSAALDPKRTFGRLWVS